MWMLSGKAHQRTVCFNAPTLKSALPCSRFSSAISCGGAAAEAAPGAGCGFALPRSNEKDGVAFVAAAAVPAGPAAFVATAGPAGAAAAGCDSADPGPLPKEKPDLALSDFSGSTALRFGLMAGFPVPCACRRHMAEALLVTLQHP